MLDKLTRILEEFSCFNVQCFNLLLRKRTNLLNISVCHCIWPFLDRLWYSHGFTQQIGGTIGIKFDAKPKPTVKYPKYLTKFNEWNCILKCNKRIPKANVNMKSKLKLKAFQKAKRDIPGAHSYVTERLQRTNECMMMTSIMQSIRSRV